MVDNTEHQFGRPTRRRYLSATAALGTLAIGSGTAAAAANDEEHTEIDERVEITEPGTYVLTENIDVDTDETGISILADDVTLDGGGRTISGDGTGFGVRVSVASNVRVRDLAVEDLRVGVDFDETVDSRIANVEATRCRSGISLFDSGTTSVRDNRLEESRLVMDDTFDTVVARNEIVDVPDHGIYDVDSSGNVYYRNRSARNRLSGIRLSDSFRNTLTQNAFVANGEYGVDFITSDENFVTDNDLSDNELGACTVADSTDNTFRGNDPECDPDD
ncbi:right-handed parallel beta-helix repeat-containing protein (plasmid) [Haloferacaceae archaeon DSL9]